MNQMKKEDRDLYIKQKEADINVEKKAFLQAVDQYKEIINTDAGFKLHFYNYAKALYQLKQLDKAEDMINNAIKSDPTNSQYY